MSEKELIAGMAERGILFNNYLSHLDEMTDEEITAMLNREPRRDGLEEERKAQPSITDRTRAEFMRDFGI